MTRAQSPHILAYGRPARGRVPRRLILCVVALTAVVLGWWCDAHYGWHGWAFARCRFLYWQHEVGGEAVPEGTVAFDRTVAGRPGVPYGVDGEMLFTDNGGGQPSTPWLAMNAAWPREPFHNMFNAAELWPHVPLYRDGPTLFVGGLPSPAGDRLVNVMLRSVRGDRGGWLRVGGDIVTPVTILRQPVCVYWSDMLMCGDDGGTAAIPAHPRATSTIATIDRGVVDPADPARFVCRCATADGRRYAFEGRLSADGRRVRVAWVTVPVASGNAGPIATPAVGR